MPVLCYPADQQKLTITCDKHTFNFLRRDEFVFLVVADEAFGRQIPFAFLDRISEDFASKYTSKGKTAGAHGLDRTVGPMLKQHMVGTICWVAEPQQFPSSVTPASTNGAR